MDRRSNGVIAGRCHRELGFQQRLKFKRAFDHGSAIVDYLFDWPGNRVIQHPAAYMTLTEYFNEEVLGLLLAVH